jgi:RimJ/RimL family protein N-acetyltransferase
MASLTQPEASIINITGEKVALGPLRRDLVPLYQKWLNDFEITRSLWVQFRPMTPEGAEGRYEAMRKNARTVCFTVYERASMRPMGSAALEDIDPVHRTAHFSISIGEKDYWGKGYGTEVTRLMLDYGFSGLGLHNILLTVFSFNERGIRAYKRAGFREISRREALRLVGETYDVIYMDCLATDFPTGGGHPAQL